MSALSSPGSTPETPPSSPRSERRNDRRVVPRSRIARAAVLCAGAAPGMLAGTQVAGLLFFLNPQLPFEPGTVARGVAYYGALLGVVSLVALAPLTRGRPSRLVAWLPASITTVLVLSGAGFWAHAYYYNFFLPPGINKRLLKAAIWLSLAGLIGFYTVLIHRLRQRRYGRRSMALFALLALASIYVVVERREAFRPRVEPSPRPTTFEAPGRPTLRVVGIDAATLDAILPLAERGVLPFFDRIRSEGARARLHSLEPMRGSPLWLTLTTGKYPYEHGIVGDWTYRVPFLASDRHRLRLLPLSVGFQWWGVRDRGRPVALAERRALNLWEMLDRVGSTTAVVGWPSAVPGPESRIVVPGTFFDEEVRAVRERLGPDPPENAPSEDAALEDPSSEDAAPGGVGETWASRGGEPADDVSPAGLAERARLFRQRPDELDPVEVSRFGQPPDPRILEALAGDRWRQDLGLYLAGGEPPVDALFLLLPGLRQVSREAFGGFTAAQFRGSQDEEALRARRTLSAYYRHLDDFLARLWSQMRPPRLLVIASSHGVREPTDMGRLLGLRESVEGSYFGAPDGVFLLLGEGIRPGASIREAKLVDVVPTLLYGLGHPIARDLEGEVLTEVFETSFLARRPLAFVPSYETFRPRLEPSP